MVVIVGKLIHFITIGQHRQHANAVLPIHKISHRTLKTNVKFKNITFDFLSNFLIIAKYQQIIVQHIYLSVQCLPLSLMYLIPCIDVSVAQLENCFSRTTVYFRSFTVPSFLWQFTDIMMVEMFNIIFTRIQITLQRSTLLQFSIYSLLEK